MKLRVRDEDIAAGEKFSLHSCPIGLAAQRSFTGKTIRVSYKYIGVDDVLYELPKSIEQWQLDYEDGKPVTACEFKLELVKKK